MDGIEKVGKEGPCLTDIADEDRLGCTWDVQNNHRLGLLEIPRVPFYHR